MINHPYLEKKGVSDHGAKLDDHGKLIIPARNIYGEITTVQTIAANGEKRFLNGGTKKGSSFTLDDQIINPNGIANITEGFSTAATVQEATGKPTICAFDAGNLLPVAEAIRGRYSDVEIVICGDDDRFKDKNTGREKATAAAIAVGGKVCFPSFKSDDGKPTDFNDLHQREGLEVVRTQIGAAKMPDAEREDQKNATLLLPGGNQTLNKCAGTLGKLLAKTGRFYVRNGGLHEVEA